MEKCSYYVKYYIVCLHCLTFNFLKLLYDYSIYKTQLGHILQDKPYIFLTNGADFYWSEIIAFSTIDAIIIFQQS